MMSKEPRKTIGRQLNSQASIVEGTNVERSQIFTLKNGRKVTFKFIRVPSSEVEATTFVNQETNGRDQLALTKESLKSIIKTIKFQQFFACIGVQKGERIEILDGSRRRASAIIVHTGLDVMVTNEHLSAEEARQLAKDIQTAKEHNLREIGLRLLGLKESGLNQKDIAETEGMSQAKVTRAMQAAAVPQELILLFPVQSELSFSDYKSLLEISENLSIKDISSQQLVESLSEELDVIISDDHNPDDEQKARILKLISKASHTLISKPPKDRSVVSSLWSFDEKDKFARKRIKGRTLTYEFNRMPKELQDELDKAIAEVLNRNLSQ
ncbi:ParB/RepB/Spo0J family partition protein [Enterobacteriaceae bacterium H11S18]|uniref:ParB family protein n=1 Tax=Dryocola clanedunensis TaxID=2925396 RepID=UPI0022F010E7|nr:ParB family protein [Dryocola clanedunensis]MCT4708821.1 ParB/RepB/Spo0J family partition protein [Dryocola clanedunensis]